MSTKKELLNLGGFSYLGSTKISQKFEKSEKAGVLTYCVYLAPADLSGRNVCPKSKYCKASCLAGAGRAKLDILSGQNRITSARIKKADMYFDHKGEFVELLCKEIETAKNRATKQGKDFAVRFNGTSDINPIALKMDGKNILEIFKDVQFYDYTKVFARYESVAKYPNYDLTFSYDGHNWEECEKVLNSNGRISVVFDCNELPTEWRGYRVINGDLTDIRFNDPKGVIVGLHYKRVAADYKNGSYVRPDNDFVVRID